MRWNCDTGKERRYRKWKAKQQWHRWFAWYPVKVTHGDCRWLETVETKLYYNRYGDDYWEYRSLVVAA